MKQDLVTVIIPTYNAEKYIERSLNSVLNQTYDKVEIIVVNDGSTDSSEEIVNNYCLLYPNIRLISKANEGISFARNDGIKNSTGEFIMFLDSDDWIDLNTIKCCVEEMKNRKVDLVFFPYIKEYSNKSIIKEIYSTNKLLFKDKLYSKLQLSLIGPLNEEIRNVERLDMLNPVCMKLYKRDIILKNNLLFYDSRAIGTGEDGLFNIDYMNCATSALYLNKAFYHYRRDVSNSMTRVMDSMFLDKYEKLCNQYISKKELYKNDEFTKALSNRFVISIIGQGMKIVGSSCSREEKKFLMTTLIKSDSFVSSIQEFEFSFLPFHWRVLLNTVYKQQINLVMILFNFINFASRIRG